MMLVDLNLFFRWENIGMNELAVHSFALGKTFCSNQVTT